MKSIFLLDSKFPLPDAKLSNECFGILLRRVLKTQKATVLNQNTCLGEPEFSGDYVVLYFLKGATLL